MMLQIKFDCNQPAGLGDIHVWKCGCTHARTLARVPSYKLTLWAFGSGELITSRDQNCLSFFTQILWSKGTTLAKQLNSLIHAYVTKRFCSFQPDTGSVGGGGGGGNNLMFRIMTFLINWNLLCIAFFLKPFNGIIFTTKLITYRKITLCTVSCKLLLWLFT